MDSAYLRKFLIGIFTTLIVVNYSIDDCMGQFQVSVIKVHELKGISSASGSVKLNDKLYVVGDDSPYLLELNAQFGVKNKMQIYPFKGLENGRMSKKQKADFECLTVAPWGKDNDILAFGSGSGSENRDVMVRIDFDDKGEKVKSYSLAKFYEYLHKKSDSDIQLNIEGAVYWNKNLILLDRGDNALFMIDYEDFKSYVKDNDKDKPKLERISFDLPSLNGMTARFSGACMLPGENLLLFTASVENKPNWINGEEILGSYIGIIDLNQIENNKPVCQRVMFKTTPFLGKIESIVVTEKTDEAIKLIGVLDNDDGNSKLVELEFKNTNK